MEELSDYPWVVCARCTQAQPNLGLGREGPPLGQGGRASLLVDFPADEVALRIKVVVDLAMDGDEFLERLRPAEFEHRRLSSSKRLVGILGSIVLPAADFPAFEITNFPHGRAVGAQPIGDDDFGTAMAPYGFLEEFQSDGLVPPRADVTSEKRAKAIPPKPHRLMADVDAPLVQQVLYIP